MAALTKTLTKVLSLTLPTLLAFGEAVTPVSAFTTFTSADYTPSADGTTATTLTFTVKDANNVAIEGQGVTYA